MLQARSRICRIWRIWLLALAAWLTLPAWASTGVVDVDHWRDPSGRLSLEQVASASGWMKAEDPLSAGYSDHVHWLRFRIDPARAHDSLILRVGVSFLDDVALFRPLKDGGYERVQAGDRYSFRQREVPSRLFDFIIDPQRLDTSQPMYLRVRSTSSALVFLDAFRPHEVQDGDGVMQLIIGTHAGLQAMLLMWTLTQWFIFRDRTSALFLGYLVMASGMSVGLLGGFSMLEGSMVGLGDVLTSLFLLMTPLAALLFHRHFVVFVGVPRWVTWVLNFSMAEAIANLALYAAGHASLALQLNVIMLAALGLLVPLALWVSLSWRDPGHRVVMMGYMLLAIFVGVMALPLVGGPSIGRWVVLTPIAHGQLTGLVFAALLMVQRLRVVRESTLTREALVQAENERAVAQTRSDETERLLAMLAHELRTPLSVLRMVLGSDIGADASPAASRRVLQARMAVQDIDSVIERVIQADRLERGADPVEPMSCSLADVISALVLGHPQERRIRLSLDAQARRVIDSDPLLLRVVVQNLIDNALKYSPAESKVEISLWESSRGGVPGLLLQIHNEPNQAGFPDPEKIFQKYYRSPGAHRSTGSGLGLYLVQGLARRLGGSIELSRERVPGRVCFEFWVPERQEMAGPRALAVDMPLI